MKLPEEVGCEYNIAGHNGQRVSIYSVGNEGSNCGRELKGAAVQPPSVMHGSTGKRGVNQFHET